MNEKSLDKFGPKVKSGGTILMNSSLVKSRATQLDAVCFEVPAIEPAVELGDARIANSVMLGALTAISNIIKIETVKTIVVEFFLDKYPSKPEIADVNRRAVEKGYSMGNELMMSKNRG
jgi:2-oxoglutarate ferredoxin oxidoreductase subunit gamma